VRDSHYKTDTALGSRRTMDGRAEMVRQLPQGPARDGYQHHIIARIIDVEGASVEFNFGFVKVRIAWSHFTSV
jgi:methyl coenzyme M reductase subunit D